MTTIIAGDFPAKSLAEEAVRRLSQQGISRDDVHCISLNPPGQHDMESPSLAKSDLPSQTNPDELPPRGGAAGAAAGAAVGGAVGLGIGIAATPIAGPAGPIAGTGVGAYVGSLIGAMGGLAGNANEPEIRRAGVLVAVRVDPLEGRERIERTLQDAGARQVEIAVGVWHDGQWVDFDPEAEPVVVSSATENDGR